jgi:diamine N-acetyltransferase
VIDLQQIRSDNYYKIHDLYPGNEAKYWINYNWYWTELADRRTGIHTRLVTLSEDSVAVGFIALGKHYSDRLLKCHVEGSYEIYHMVIDQAFQGNGIGLASTVKAIRFLASFADCKKIMIAHHPENIAAKKLYSKLGFIEVARNYDDDPLMELDVPSFVPPTIFEIRVPPIQQQVSESWRAGSVNSQKEFNWDNWENGLET